MDRPKDGQNVHCWVCTDTWLCVCSGEQGLVCVCLFALECLRICVSCIWLCSLCVLAHVCLYVPRWYGAAKAKLSKPKPDWLHSTLCAVLLFYVSVVVEKEKFAWWSATFGPFMFPWWNIHFHICSETCYPCSTGQRASSIYVRTRKRCTTFTCARVCICTDQVKIHSQGNFPFFSSHAHPSGSYPLLTVVLYLSLPVTLCDIWLLSSLVRLKQNRGGPSVCRPAWQTTPKCHLNKPSSHSGGVN